MVLEEKTRADLGWDALRAALVARCQTTRGATAALAIGISCDVSWIQARHEEVSEAKALADGGDPLAFSGAVELEPAIDRAEKGGCLEGQALREVAATLRVAGALRRQLARQSARVPRLWGRALLLAELPELAVAIEQCFDETGRLHDRASPALGGLRQRAAVLHEELSQRARALLDHPQVTPYLQDHFYTQRDERYVLPIRADARTRVHGIVHGLSGSGQTVFVEPEEMVDLNNRLKLAELEVLEEERRILGELTQAVATAASAIRIDLEVLAELDRSAAAARLATDLSAHAPLVSDSVQLDLRHARHPLMVLGGRRCVSNDLLLERGATLVISGPNAGGKTVALKIAGLITLMAHAGLHIPAQEGSTVPLFDRVLTDIGDDQSLERNLSTFSAHIVRLRELLATAGPTTLLLLDEIAVGTDPGEGAALAQALLEALSASGATVLVTTHYDRLKALAASSARFVNASVGFDFERLQPTFELHLGVPGASGAITAAARLGIADDILVRARSLLGKETQGLVELLQMMEQERQRLAEQSEQLGQKQAEAERLTAEARDRIERARSGAHDQAVVALREARVELDRVRTVLRRKPNEAKEARAAIDRASEAVRAHAPAVAAAEPFPLEELTVGCEVQVVHLGVTGMLLTPPRDGRVAVQVGPLKMNVDVAQLGRPRGRAAPAKLARGRGEQLQAAAAMAPGAARARAQRCDLRGERVDVACAIAERFVDDALRAGDDEVVLLHGHGTGALRQSLRERLRESPAVAALRPGTPEEGGEAVTVVVLA